MKLRDLFDELELVDMIKEKFVRVQKHPDYDLYIYNYTEKAVTNNVWNDVTRQCRGLILDGKDNVIARPFPKFFNYGQPESKTYRENERVVVTDKMDGSLGILYRTPDGQWAIATRGSFTSEQALHATEVLRAKYSEAMFQESETWLFEIVYPENRIVVDYDGLDDLVLLGAVNIEAGLIYPAHYFEEESWPGPQTETFEYTSLSEALAAPSRPGREGLVVHFMNSDTMVKIKQEDYLQLHKIVTGLNEHVVWEHLKEGKDIRGLLAGLPDEFHVWALEVGSLLSRDFLLNRMQVQDRFAALDKAELTEGPRKDFALAVKDLEPHIKASLFKALDGQDFDHLLWKQLEPKKDTFVRRLD